MHPVAPFGAPEYAVRRTSHRTGCHYRDGVGNNPLTGAAGLVRRFGVPLLAAAVLVTGELQVWLHADGAGDARVAVPEVLVMSAALLFWRTRALVMVSVFTATWVTASLLGSPPDSIWALFLCLLVAFAIGSTADRRTSVLGLAFLLAATYTSLWLAPGSGLGDRLFTPPVLVGGPWLAGVLARGFREQAGLLAALNAELEDRRANDVREATRLERSRIARELHDIVSHSLAMITVQAAAALKVLEAHPDRARTPLEDIRAGSKSALVDMRRMLGLLLDEATAVNGEPGLQQIPGLLDRLHGTGVETRYEILGARPVLGPDQDLAAYRIVQEAVTNALKHGAATRVAVTLQPSPDQLDLEIRDNGRPNGHSDGTGHGIIAMRQRAALAGGSLDAGPVHGGWLVHLTLPTTSGDRP